MNSRIVKKKEKPKLFLRISNFIFTKLGNVGLAGVGLKESGWGWGWGSTTRETF